MSARQTPAMSSQHNQSAAEYRKLSDLKTTRAIAALYQSDTTWPLSVLLFHQSGAARVSLFTVTGT